MFSEGISSYNEDQVKDQKTIQREILSKRAQKKSLNEPCDSHAQVEWEARGCRRRRHQEFVLNVVLGMCLLKRKQEERDEMKIKEMKMR